MSSDVRSAGVHRVCEATIDPQRRAALDKLVSDSMEHLSTAKGDQVRDLLYEFEDDFAIG